MKLEIDHLLGFCHTNGMDEAFTIPSEEAMRLSLRTQQVISDETNITSVVDPLGGSYLVETLTTQMETEIFVILENTPSPCYFRI